MCQTGDRDGFVPAPLSDYQSMVRVLGAEHCRVYAGRVDGKLVAWSLVTISGKRATRYYAATAVGAGRLRVADVLVLFECEHAAELGCTEYDLMGIGSEFAPETMNLNEFKTKFAKEGEIKIAPIAMFRLSVDSTEPSKGKAPSRCEACCRRKQNRSARGLSPGRFGRRCVCLCTLP